MIALAFLGTPISVSPVAAVKSGDNCKSLGQVKTVSGYRYTCKKSGNKLVWSKGSKLAAGIAKPSTSTQILKKRVAPVPVFGTPSISSNGFTVQILSFDPFYTWSATVSLDTYSSSGDSGLAVIISPLGLITVTGLNPSTSATVSVKASCAGCASSSARFAANSAPRTKTLLETRLSESYKSELERDVPFTLIIQNPNLSSKNRYLIEEFKKHLRWLSGIGADITKPLYVIYADTAEWMNEEFKRQGCVFTPGHRLPLGGFAIMADCAGKYIITRPNADREAHESSIEAQNGLIHEAFHQWQDQAIRTGSEYGQRYGLRGDDWPKWLIEGGAHAVSRYAFWERNGKAKSPEQVMKDWFAEAPYLTRDCVGVNIRDMVKNIPNGEKGGLCAYSKGQVAIDLFIEKFGVNSFFDLYRSPKSPGLGDFARIFRTATGQDVESFYDEVDKEMKLRGWS